jgi:hypothetical protein
MTSTYIFIICNKATVFNQQIITNRKAKLARLKLNWIFNYFTIQRVRLIYTSTVCRFIDLGHTLLFARCRCRFSSPILSYRPMCLVINGPFTKAVVGVIVHRIAVLIWHGLQGYGNLPKQAQHMESLNHTRRGYYGFNTTAPIPVGYPGEQLRKISPLWRKFFGPVRIVCSTF